jgi:hypothetical protein
MCVLHLENFQLQNKKKVAIISVFESPRFCLVYVKSLRHIPAKSGNIDTWTSLTLFDSLLTVLKRDRAPVRFLVEYFPSFLDLRFVAEIEKIIIK